jgi:hypothetical protein
MALKGTKMVVFLTGHGRLYPPYRPVKPGFTGIFFAFASGLSRDCFVVTCHQVRTKSVKPRTWYGLGISPYRSDP